MKKVVLLFFILSLPLFAATTYTWNTTNGGAWTTTTNWNPTRTSPAVDDILVFNNNISAGYTVTAVPAQTIGSLQISGSTTNVILNAGAANSLTISGSLTVAAGCSLQVATATALTLALTTSGTATIYGVMYFNGGAHRFTSLNTTAGNIDFKSGSALTTGASFTGGIFGSTSPYNVAVFESGSWFNSKGGGNPFAATSPNTMVIFNAGSTYSVQQNSTPSLSGRTYANLDFNFPAYNQNSTGGSALVCDNITVTSAVTVGINMTGAVTINGGISVNSGTLTFAPATAPSADLILKGNVSVATGCGLSFSPTVSGVLNFGGSIAQTVTKTGTGTLTLSSLETVKITNTAGVTFNSAQTISGPTTVSTSCTLATGVALTFAGTVGISGTFQLNDGGSATGGTWTYTTGTLAFNATSSSFAVGTTPAYWPTSNGPTNVSVLGSAGATFGVARTISGIFQTTGPITGGSYLTLSGTCQLNAGGSFLLTSPVYSTTSSILVYNTGAAANTGYEWIAGASVGSGVPQSITIQASGTSITLTGNRSAIGTLTLSSGATLKCATYVLAGGTFTLASGGTLGIGSSVGITTAGNATGNIQTTTRTYNAGGIYLYNAASGTQVTGNGLPTSITGGLKISNTSGAVTCSQATAIGTGGTCAVDLGATLTTGAFTFSAVVGVTVNVNGSFQIDQSGWGGNTGTYNYGTTGTLIFNNSSGSYGVNTTDTYWPSTNGPINVTVQNGGGMTLNAGVARTITGTLLMSNTITNSAANLTLNGICQINGGNFTNSPVYGSSSTLIYNVTYGPYVEWNGNGAPGTGIPKNVTVQAGTLTLPSTSLGIQGNFTIGTGTTVTMNGTSGDLYVGGNWSNSGAFNPSGRAVFFTGSGTQTVTKTGGETFNYLLTTGGGTLQLINNITVNATSGDALSLAGNIDLNGNTLIMSGSGGNLTVTGSARSINATGSGTLSITGSKTINYTSGGTLSLGSTVALSIPSGGALSLGSIGSPLTVSGNINIGGSLTLSSASGGDLNLGGTWTNSGSFTTNGRAVTFNGTGTQTITNASGETFAYLLINKTAGSVQLANNVTVNGGSGAALQLLNTGGLDLYGKTLTLSGTGIQVTGAARTITATNTPTASGTFAFTGAATVTSTSSGLLVFDTPIAVTIGTNAVDFGSGLTTIKNSLQINTGGAVINNGAAFGTGATLYYNAASGADYLQVKEWPTTNGPTNVTILNNTVLKLQNDINLTGNLTVTNGSLQSVGVHTLTMSGTTQTITVSNSSGGAIYGTDKGPGNDLHLQVNSSSTTTMTGNATTNSDNEKLFEQINVDGTLALSSGILCKYGSFTVSSTGKIQINANGYIQATLGAPASYSSGGTLIYANGGVYTSTDFEWPTTNSPTNVQLNAASTNVTLNNSKSITGTLTLTNGVLTLAGNDLTLSNAVSNAGTSNYICTSGSGSLIRTVGGSAVIFPVGYSASSDYTPITFSNTGTSQNYKVRAVSLTTAPAGGLKRQWNIKETSSPNHTTFGTITLGWTNTGKGNLATGSCDLVCNITGNNQPYDLLKSGVSATGTDPYAYTTSIFTKQPLVIPSGGLFISLVQSNAPLPVELSTFTTYVNGRTIQLNWETKTEKNSNKFEIERSSLANDNWSSIGSVKAADLSNSPKDYSFEEKNLQTGKYQYRLKMVDNDGTFQYSKVVESEITLPKNFELSQNYPNPFNPSTKINYSLPFDSKVIMDVYSITGEKVGQLVNQQQAAGYYTVDFNSSTLNRSIASGIYIYRISAVDKATGNNFISTKKMILIK